MDFMALDNKDMYVGIEIGGTKLQIVTGNASCSINKRLRYSVKAADGADGIRAQIKEGLKALLHAGTVRSIGVGFGGPVDWKSGTIHLSHQIEGWTNFDIKAWLQELTGLPAAVDNDGNTAALAEAKQGCGKSYNNVFYMTIGSGIGGGMVIKEKIYHGRLPGEVEIGHIRLNKSGQTLEDKCSGWAVNKRIRDHITDNPTCRLADIVQKGELPEAHYLAEGIKEKDTDATSIVNDVADDIAFALSHVVHLFNPDVLIIGGGLSLLKESLLLPVTQILPRYLMKALLPAPTLKISMLGEDVVPVGALELARQLNENN